MKKLILFASMFCILCIGLSNANAQPPHAKAHHKKGKHKVHKVVKKANYYYYPSANVYYSPVQKRYWYRRSNKWVYVQTLPSTIIIHEQPRYVVYAEPDVYIWQFNTVHIQRYPPRRTGVDVNVNIGF